MFCGKNLSRVDVQDVDLESKESLDSKSKGTLKLLASLGALAGGAFVSSSTVSADQVAGKTKTVSANTVLANKDTVQLSSNINSASGASTSGQSSESNTTSDSASQSTSTSESASTYKSSSQSESISVSESLSNSSASTSESTLASNSSSADKVSSTKDTSSTSVTSSMSNTTASSESAVSSSASSSENNTVGNSESAISAKSLSSASSTSTNSEGIASTTNAASTTSSAMASSEDTTSANGSLSTSDMASNNKNTASTSEVTSTSEMQTKSEKASEVTDEQNTNFETENIAKQAIVANKSITTLKATTVSENKESLQAANTGFSVSDPTYPNGMPDNGDNANRYSFEWVKVYSSKNLRGSILVSIDRNDSGTLYIKETKGTNTVELTLTANDASATSNSFAGLTYYYDNVDGNYSFVIKGNGYGLENDYVNYTTGSNKYATITNFVPKKISQTTTYVDENGNSISGIDPVTQSGWTGQDYTTSAGKVVTGYYTIDTNQNGNGKMSQFGKIGAKYEKNYHDGYVRVVYTQTDANGTMQVQIYDRYWSGGTEYLADTESVAASGSTTYTGNSGSTYNIVNPYVNQTQDIQYQYHKLGSLIVKDENGTIISQEQYVNDTTDASEAYYPSVADKPGYIMTAEDADGNTVNMTDIKNGSVPANLSKDTIITLKKDPVSVSQSTSVSMSGSASTSAS
ncbi:serine-rich repeat protein [Liquorilactobacillus uvarum DSM 19971]|uniref:Serine-rich repeat protein n=1 Tax=Liquorilactobacillus uvarum DSM 19971 TaxID=1423812 RepID=A0A0R1PRH9_9LACO|nr:serine-rich repeat protein [Liquorilactobacillus uvarum DSM 19971]